MYQYVWKPRCCALLKKKIVALLFEMKYIHINAHFAISRKIFYECAEM